MDIKKLTDYFHDGAIRDVNISGTEIILTMYSAQVEADEVGSNISLGKFNEIRGRLHLLNPKEIIINDVISSTNEIKHQKGTILDFNCAPDRIVLNISWRLKGQSNIYESIEFRFVDYFFENLPNLHFFDDADFDDDGIYIKSH